eukprot:SAG31_NODE_1484_length_8160_cov_5.766778_6_plen_441_part_00
MLLWRAAILLQLLSLLLSVSSVAERSTRFHPPTLVGESNWSHFWMPATIFKGGERDLIMSIDLAGDGKPCPPPGHPQNCSALYCSADNGASWTRKYGNIPGMALPISQLAPSPDAARTRVYNFASKSTGNPHNFSIFSSVWLDSPSAGIQRVSAESFDVVMSGFPLMAGTSSGPSASGNVILLAGVSPPTHLGTFYGRLRNSTHGCHPYEGAGAPPWPGCDSAFFAASTDAGRSWAYRSHIDWNPSMPTKAEGVTESSITQLQNGTLLSVSRLQSNLPLYKAFSTDEARSWSTPERMDAWAVYPQLRSLPNGAVVLASGRPGLGFWSNYAGDGLEWQFHNLCAVHNQLLELSNTGVQNRSAYLYQPTEVSVQNHSSPGTWPAQTKAYMGMVVLDETEAACRGSSCDLLIAYDRLANGNSGPPGPWGQVDAVFAMRITVTA